MIEDLIKPCPKCGSEAVIEETDNGYSIIKCPKMSSSNCCGQYGEMYVMVFGPLSNAISIWNRRLND